MRLFQDIDGSEVIYINTYAATTPRLSAFKGICSSSKDNGEDYVDDTVEEESCVSMQSHSKAYESSEEVPAEANFSRDLFQPGLQNWISWASMTMINTLWGTQVHYNFEAVFEIIVKIWSF